MRKLNWIILAAGLCVANICAAETLGFRLSPWKATCVTGVCGLPVAIDSTQRAVLDLRIPTAPETATNAQTTIEWPELRARLQVLHIWPAASSGHPRYYQIQLEILAPVRAFCASSPRADWGTLPPLICASDTDQARWGITLVHE